MNNLEEIRKISNCLTEKECENLLNYFEQNDIYCLKKVHSLIRKGLDTKESIANILVFLYKEKQEKESIMNWKVFEEKYPLSYIEVKKYLDQFDVSKLNNDDLMASFLNSKGIPLYGMWVRGLRVLEEKLQNEKTPKQLPKDNQLSMF